MALTWTAPGWLPEGWQPGPHGEGPPPVVIHRHLTAMGSLDTRLVVVGSLDTRLELTGDMLVASYVELRIQRGEDITLTVPVLNLGGESLAGWPFSFRLLDSYEGNVLAEIVTAVGVTPVGAMVGITATDPDTLEVVIPSAVTDRQATRYYLTLGRTLPGDRAVILYGPVDIRKPKAV